MNRLFINIIAFALLFASHFGEASASNNLNGELGPCLEKICIGMSIDEVLSRDIHLVDGRVVRAAMLEERIASLRAMLGSNEVEKRMKRLGINEEFEEQPNSKNARAFKNLDDQERGYLSTFWPDDGDIASLDRPALEYISKATLCRYLPVTATALGSEERPIKIEFLPFGDGLSWVVSRIERNYQYRGPERERFKENVYAQYGEYEIELRNIPNGSPTIVLLLRDQSQKLTLLHPYWWNFATMSDAGLTLNGQDGISEALMEQAGCFDSESPI